ncbi:MAG TPA: ABC transporter ATP-binding protein [Planctomycetes bacterium]|nr:ABC transporter ATP-binding protein [Planctomycetota bacterium]
MSRAKRVSAPVLDLVWDDLRLRFPGQKNPVLDGVGLRLEAGRTLGLLGESGSGKSLSTLAALGLLPRSAIHVGGTIRLGDTDLLSLDARARRRLLGATLGAVFQDPSTALNPYLTVGFQMSEGLRRIDGIPGREAREICLEALETCRIREPRRALRSRPHELSGGEKQRVLIAMATVRHPDFLLADEPTTALDVATRGAVLEVLLERGHDLGMGLLLVSHDIFLLGECVEQMAVMYAGRIVESGPTRRLLTSPRHPYTRGLLAAAPRLEGPRGRLPEIPGHPPAVDERLPGCPFAPRCSLALPSCAQERPAWVSLGEEGGFACPVTETEG